MKQILFVFIFSLAIYLVIGLKSADFCRLKEKKCLKPYEYECDSELCSKDSIACQLYSNSFVYSKLNRQTKAISFMEPTYLNSKMKELNQVYEKRLKRLLNKTKNCTRYIWRPEHVSILNTSHWTLQKLNVITECSWKATWPSIKNSERYWMFSECLFLEEFSDRIYTKIQISLRKRSDEDSNLKLFFKSFMSLKVCLKELNCFKRLIVGVKIGWSRAPSYNIPAFMRIDCPCSATNHSYSCSSKHCALNKLACDTFNSSRAIHVPKCFLDRKIF